MESDWESFVEPMIEDGYYFSEISSGDGTEGFNEGQIFVNGMTGEYFILQSDYISELDYEHIDFNEELQDDPVRVDSYRWDVLRYDKIPISVGVLSPSRVTSTVPALPILIEVEFSGITTSGKIG